MKIEFDVVIPTDKIVLHSWDIEIQTAIVARTVEFYKVNSITFDTFRKFVIIKLDKTLQPGKGYQMVLVYTGQIVEENNGFYRSSYKVGNKTRLD